MKLRQLTGKILKGFGVSLLFLFILELSARVDDWIRWDAPVLSNYTYENLRISDSLGYHNQPNTRYEKWKINSHGFRGSEITMEKPEGIIRVIVVGASETFGLYESEGMEYPSQMQTLLDTIKPGQYQIVNAACPGMSPPRIGHFYRKWLIKFDPDIVVYYPSPSFYILRKPPQPEILFHQGIIDDKGLNLRLPAKAMIVLKSFIPLSIQTEVREFLIKRVVEKKSSDWVYKEIPEGRLQLYKEHVSSFAKEIINNGTDVILATHGTRFDSVLSSENKPFMTTWRKMYPHISENVFLSMEKMGNNVLHEFTNENDIRLVDINKAIPKEIGFYADHAHFTDKGATIVAREFVNEILNLEKDKIKEDN